MNTEEFAAEDDREAHVLDPASRNLLFTGARTANSFSQEPVSDAELSGIWELAKWAPTSTNSQPMRVLYVRTGEGRERLLRHVKKGNREKARSAPVVAVLAADTQFHEHIPTVLPFRPELREAYEADRQARHTTAHFNATLQAGYFILAVRAHGLAAGPMSGFDAKGVDAEFFPDGRLRSILLVNIGHPGIDPWFDRLPRLAHREVILWA